MLIRHITIYPSQWQVQLPGVGIATGRGMCESKNNLLNDKNFNYDFYSNFNADNKSISSPLEVKFENSIIKILYDSKKKLDDSDINRIIHSINYAIEKKYRFFSYGDSSLLVFGANF